MPTFASLRFASGNPHNTIACHTFGALRRECIYAKTSWQLEQTHLRNIMSSYNEEIVKLNTDLSTMRVDTKEKRAIINIGGILSQLFGVASTESIDDLQRQIVHTARYVKNNANSIDSMYEFVSKFKNNTYSNFRSLAGHLNKSDTALRETMNRVNNLTFDINKIRSNFDFYSHEVYVLRSYTRILTATQRLIQQTTTLQRALANLREFRQQIQLLNRHLLPDKLVSQSTLQGAIDKISSPLRKRGLQPLSAYIHMDYFYHYTKCIAYLTSDTLIISVELPLTTSNAILDVYRVITFKLPLHTSEGNHVNKTTELQTNHDYMVFSRDRDSFGYLTQHQYDRCARQDYICEDPIFLYGRERNDCLYNIFVNHKITSACSFITSETPLEPAVFKVGHSRFLLQKLNTPIRVSCKHKEDSFHRINSHALIDLACGCKMHSDMFSIQPHSKKCSIKEAPIEISYPLNVAQMISMDTSILQNVTNAKATVKTEPRLLQEYNELPFKPETSLNQPVRNGIDNVLETAEFIPHFKSDLSEIIITVGVILWNTCLTLAIIFLFVRFKSALLLGLITTNATTTNGYILNQHHLPTATSLPHRIYEINIPPGLSILASTALILVCIRICCKLWSRFKKPTPKGEKAKLYVKIFDAKKTSLIYLTDIPLDVKIKFNELPIMERFSVTYKRLWPRIDIKWRQKLSFTFEDQVQEIELPTSIKISLMESEKLNAINTSGFITFYALLYVPDENNIYRNLEHINDRLSRPSRS